MANAEQITARSHILGLVRAFVAGPDRGIALAGRIENTLQDAFPDNIDMQDLVISLACYRPEGGPHLYNEAEMLELLINILPKIERLIEN